MLQEQILCNHVTYVPVQIYEGGLRVGFACTLRRDISFRIKLLLVSNTSHPSNTLNVKQNIFNMLEPTEVTKKPSAASTCQIPPSKCEECFSLTESKNLILYFRNVLCNEAGTVIHKSVRSVSRIIQTGKTEVLQEKPVQRPSCPSQFPYGRASN